MSELHQNTEQAFVEYLIASKYPKESVVLEWGTNGYAVDIAIIGKDGVTPIAIYEIKVVKNSNALQRGIHNLKTASKRFNLCVPCYLVFGYGTPVQFEVFDVSDIVNKNEEYSVNEVLKNNAYLTHIISYSVLKESDEPKRAKGKAIRKDKYTFWFNIVCWVVFPIVVIVLLLAEYQGCYELTTERLLLFLFLAIIVIVPFFNEITVKDIGFKRTSDKEKANEEDSDE